MKKFLLIFLMLLSIPSFAQHADRRDVRAGNGKYRHENYKEAQISYLKALVKDSTSLAANFNLSDALYRMEDYENAGKSLEKINDAAPEWDHSADYHFNTGDIALQKKDYSAAMEAFKQSLLKNPGDMDAKESYLYAKKMLENRQNQGGGDRNQDQDNDQDQNQDQNQDNNQDQNQNQDQNNNQNQDDSDDNGDQGGEQPQISPQQATQMLQAVQAKERDTQDKVNKEKAAALKSRQKEKNW